MSAFEEYNKSTGFHKAIESIGGFITPANLLLAIIGIMCFILQKIGIKWNVPEEISGYDHGILVAANALLLLVLNNAHDRYYLIYINSSELSFVGNLLDLFIKIVLFLATMLQTIFVSSIIPLATIAYILTFARNVELKSTLPKTNPLYERIGKDWLPYNLRHNLVMLMFCGSFHLLKFKLLYIAMSWLCCDPIDANIFLTPIFTSLHSIVISTFILFFDIYWVFRVLRKVKLRRDNIFRMKKMEKIKKELEDYCESSEG